MGKIKNRLDKNKHLQEVITLYKKFKSSEEVAKVLSEKYGIPYNSTLGRKIRKWVSKEGLTTNNAKIEDSEVFKNAQTRQHCNDAKYYIVTSAQNASEIHKPFWKNIVAYAKHIGAEIEVIPIRYKNPTSNFKDLPHDWWDEALTPYLIASRYKIHKYLTVAGDLKTQPTAAMPLSGIEGLTGESSCIIGHPRQHFVTVPTLEGSKAKFLASTGSVTLENYTDSKAGKKGEFHHVFGFIIVEKFNDEEFNIRQVSADKDGAFYDLDFRVDNEQVTVESDAVDAVVLGDLHYGEATDNMALDTSFKMLKRFNPKHVLLHDLLDSSSISHHERKDPFKSLQRELDGTWCMDCEIERCVDFVGELLEYNPVIVRSNHDEFVDRWLVDIDWRKEKNKYSYLKYGKLRADGMLPKGILGYNIKERFDDKVVVLTDNDSFKVNGVELAVHGHLGAGGSRGSYTQFKRLNTKLVTGHTHSPLKIDNLTTTGTLTKLRLEYNRGLSAWYHANVIVHKNGKTQIILIHGDKYSTILNSNNNIK